jgi:hypothetical protein
LALGEEANKTAVDGRNPIGMSQAEDSESNT